MTNRSAGRHVVSHAGGDAQRRPASEISLGSPREVLQRGSQSIPSLRHRPSATSCRHACRRRVSFISIRCKIEFICYDLTPNSSQLSGSKCVVKRPSLPWLWPIRQDSAAYYVLIGYSHGKLGYVLVLLVLWMRSCFNISYVQARLRWRILNVLPKRAKSNVCCSVMILLLYLGNTYRP